MIVEFLTRFGTSNLDIGLSAVVGVLLIGWFLYMAKFLLTIFVKLVFQLVEFIGGLLGYEIKIKGFSYKLTEKEEVVLFICCVLAIVFGVIKLFDLIGLLLKLILKIG